MIYVYRAFDAGGRLLYVGMTKDLVKRIAGHGSSHWIWDVESLTADVFASRREAHAAEVQAIRTEHPRWNVMHTANVRQAVAEYRAIEATRYTPAWTPRGQDNSLALSRRLRRLTWPIQYGVTLQPLDEAGEIINF